MFHSLIGALSFFKTQRDAESARTRHYYALRATKIELPPKEKLERDLKQLGYEVLWVKHEGLQLRDRRVRPIYGQVTLGAVQHLPDGDIMEVTTADNGPEFYDELANYVIAVLGRYIEGLCVREANQPEVLASERSTQLPNSPYGLIGIKNLG